MSLQERINSLRSTPSKREEERREDYRSIEEMGQTLHGFLVVSIKENGQVVVTQ